MGHPDSPGKAIVDGKFEERIKELEEKARDHAEHFRNNTNFRKWHVPPEFNDPLDVPSLHVPAWERNNINQLYSEEIVGKWGDDAGSHGDAQAMKWQADYMAAEERAFRTRHASMIRCAAHAHGRLDGHGQQGQSLFTFFKEGVQTAIDFGSKKD
jgi:hypothetical protein